VITVGRIPLILSLIETILLVKKHMKVKELLRVEGMDLSTELPYVEFMVESVTAKHVIVWNIF